MRNVLIGYSYVLNEIKGRIFCLAEERRRYERCHKALGLATSLFHKKKFSFYYGENPLLRRKKQPNWKAFKKIWVNVVLQIFHEVKQPWIERGIWICQTFGEISSPLKSYLFARCKSQSCSRKFLYKFQICTYDAQHALLVQSKSYRNKENRLIDIKPTLLYHLFLGWKTWQSSPMYHLYSNSLTLSQAQPPALIYAP